MIKTWLSIWPIEVAFRLNFIFVQKLVKTVAPIQNCFINTKLSLKVKFIRLYWLSVGAMPKQVLKNLQTTLQKSWNWFLDPENNRNNLLRRPKFVNFRGHISTFRAENSPKSWAFKAKTMPKQLLNNSKTTLKKPRKFVFWPLKCQKNQNIDVNLAQKGRF